MEVKCMCVVHFASDWKRSFDLRLVSEKVNTREPDFFKTLNSKLKITWARTFVSLDCGLMHLMNLTQWSLYFRWVGVLLIVESNEYVYYSKTGKISLTFAINPKKERKPVATKLLLMLRAFINTKETRKKSGKFFWRMNSKWFKKKEERRVTKLVTVLR